MQLIVCTAVALSCFFVYSFVYLFIYYSLNIFSLCVFGCICLLITTLISSYFLAWPSHSARLAFAISKWLCSLFFSQLFTFYDSTLLYQDHNKDCCVLLYVTRVRRIPVMATQSFDEYALNVEFTILHFKFTFWFDPICEMFKSEIYLIPGFLHKHSGAMG